MTAQVLNRFSSKFTPFFFLILVLWDIMPPKRSEKAEGCSGCNGRAPNWTEPEVLHLIGLIDDHLPQLGKEDILWQTVTTELNSWRTTRKSGDVLRCIHGVKAYYKKIEGEFRADAKSQTGGKDRKPWYASFASMKERESSRALAAPVPSLASAVSPSTPTAAAASASATVPAPTPAVSAAQARADAMRAAARARQESTRRKQQLQEAALMSIIKSSTSAAKPPVRREAVRACTSCGSMWALDGSVLAAPLPNKLGCTHDSIAFQEFAVAGSPSNKRRRSASVSVTPRGGSAAAASLALDAESGVGLFEPDGDDEEDNADDDDV